MHKLVSVNIGKKKVQLRFIDEVINISPETYTEFKLYPKKEVSDKEYKEILRKEKSQADYSYAVKLVSTRVYTSKQIDDKLLKRKVSKKNREEIIKKLTDSHLLDDSVYIKTYKEYYDNKLYGSLRIKEELKRKGITIEDIAKIKFDDKDEEKKAIELIHVLDVKYAKYPYLKRKEKVSEGLYRYGYPYELIESVISYLPKTNAKGEKENLKVEYKKAKEKYSKKYKGYELKVAIIKYLVNKGYRYTDIMEINK